MVRSQVDQVSTYWTRQSLGSPGYSNRVLKIQGGPVKIPTIDLKPILYTIEFIIDSSPPGEYRILLGGYFNQCNASANSDDYLCSSLNKLNINDHVSLNDTYAGPP